MIHVLIPTTPDRKERLKKTIASIEKSFCNQPIKIEVEMNDYEGFTKPFLRLINRVDGLAFFVGNDVEVKADTIQILYDTYIKNFPEQDGMCSPIDPDVYFKDKPKILGGICEHCGTDAKSCFHAGIASHPFAHTRTFREVVNPNYFHNFVDREWTDVMRKRKKLLIVPEAIITHNHYSKDPDLIDRTYWTGEAHSNKDGKLYYSRRAKNFPKW